MKIAIVEDHDILRETMSKLLGEEENVSMIFEASNGKELLTIMRKNALDIIILDLNMPVMDGRETMKVLRSLEENKKPGIIILSMYDSIDHIRKYIKLGANAFLSKGCDYSELLAAIDAVYNSGFYFNKTVTNRLVNGILRSSEKITLDDPLSSRETQILQLICKQRTSYEISDQLEISHRTVENHRLHIMKKIGAKNGVGLLVYAMKNGLLDVEQL